MSPFIKDGDLITISPLTGNSPRLGDVVAFIRPKLGKLVVHRVVGKNQSFFLIKGDNTAEVDGLIPKKMILGRLTGVERHGRKIFLGLGPERLLIAFLTRWGLFFPLLIPVWKFFRPIRKWLTV